MSYSKLVHAKHTHGSLQAKRSSGIAQFVDNRTTAAAQLKLQNLISNSPQAAAQRIMQAMMNNSAVVQQKTVQRAGDEELLQGKFETTQRVEDEELLQGKFEAVQRLEDEELLQGKFAAPATAQLEEKSNNTGLPNQLKAGIESLSGMSMDHVKVHYNSAKPAQLNAHAYAQGGDIHVAPGQTQHLPHEAWHVVQQAQGRVKPTMQMKAGVPVNDDAGLEAEADVMGAKALASGLQQSAGSAGLASTADAAGTVQCRSLYRPTSQRVNVHMSDGWGAKYGITKDDDLATKVKAVKGAGTIDLGVVSAPATETALRGEFSKNCQIIYEDKSEGSGKYKTNYTNVTHCGPSGSPIRD